MLAHLSLATYVLVCLAALTWPVYPWVAERFPGSVLGLPFAFAWNVVWVLASFLALILYHRARGRARP